MFWDDTLYKLTYLLT